MKKCDNRAPLEITNKKHWINVERMRWATQFSIPIYKETPKGFPILTLQTMRAMNYLNETYGQAELIKALDVLYKSFWEEGNGGVGKAEGEKGFGNVLKGVLESKVLEDMMGNVGSKVAKDALMANTDRGV